MQELVYQLFNEQMLVWELARNNNFAMQNSMQKRFNFGNFCVYVKCNPARISSLMAKLDKKSIESRPCFLCTENRPVVQRGVEVGNFVILVNPYPIFENHFTIAHKNHTEQKFLPYINDFLNFAKNLPDFAIFYNGAKCGASCPDHQHFQAAPKNYFPVINDCKSNQSEFKFIKKGKNFRVFSFKNYLRNIIVIEAESGEKLTQLFENECFKLKKDDSEPMFNILCFYEKGEYRLMIFPRKGFRPTQFYETDEEKRLIFSPGTVEMSGIFVTSHEKSFNKIKKNDIINIYSQIS
ncbi:MAG: DUF4922 domain-containing protein [Prevotellaceae bacterium]|jgi:hypothetical protein|nr:DUF4922 domain-containing protein [Prevotellaceae bacterium]